LDDFHERTIPYLHFVANKKRVPWKESEKKVRRNGLRSVDLEGGICIISGGSGETRTLD
jgi:hypothetical protein